MTREQRRSVLSYIPAVLALPLTDGLLALRYLFGFRGAALVTGAVDLIGCTRCDAASIEAYLAGLS